LKFIEDYKIVRKILDWLGIYEFKRDRPPPGVLAAAVSFDDYLINYSIIPLLLNKSNI